VLALVNRRLPPILNYETPDPACPITPASADHADPGDSFVNLSVTPQGQASAVVVRQLA
jgi:3-oxoacyl-[acyl-carrier-protein] synthase II